MCKTTEIQGTVKGINEDDKPKHKNKINEKRVVGIKPLTGVYAMFDRLFHFL